MSNSGRGGGGGEGGGGGGSKVKFVTGEGARGGRVREGACPHPRRGLGHSPSCFFSFPFICMA